MSKFSDSLSECVPCAFVLLLLAFTYYAYIIEYCVKIVLNKNTLQFSLYVSIFHIFLCLMLLTYFKTMCTQLPPIPARYHIPDDLFLELETCDDHFRKETLLVDFIKKRNLTVITRSKRGSVSRTCSECRLVKPDRAHHCSTCHRCILKMDHHCPWIKTCICFANYKSFVLFLLYKTLLCSFTSATLLEHAYQLLSEETNLLETMNSFCLLCLIVSVAFGTVLLFFYIDHLWLIFQNKTTLEKLQNIHFLDPGDKVSFSIGFRSNFVEVFGRNMFLWLIPVDTSLGDGLVYPITFFPRV